MARSRRLRWTRLAAALVVVASGGGVLAATLPWRGQRGPILSQIPIGSLTGISNGNPLQVDGRAFIIDDGVIDRVVTMQGGSGGYSWSGVPNNAVVRQVDMATGRLQGSVTLNAGSGGGEYVLDPATQRVFVIDPAMERITVLDARQGTILAAPSWPTDKMGAPVSMTTLNAAVIDPRSGHVFLFMAAGSSVAAGQPPPQAVVMLDGRTGQSLRVLSFPPGPALTWPGTNGTPSTSYASTLSLTLDPHLGRLDIFDARGRITVVDTGNGTVMWARRFRSAITGAIMDRRTGRIFGFDASQNPWVVGGRLTRYGSQFAGGVVTIDAATGTVVRRVPGGRGLVGLGWGGAWGVALDARTSRLFVANQASRSVGVVDAASGRVLRTVALGAPLLQVASDPARRRVLVIMSPGGRDSNGVPDSTLVVLDARDGTVLRTIPLGQPASLLAVDSVSGHLVMAASSIQPGPTDPWSWVPSAVRSRIPAIPPPPPVGPSQHVLHTRVLIVDPSGS